MKNWKDNVSFVLVGPREAGNIGASARAIKNLGFRRLELVAPAKGKFPSDEATWFAHSALDVLDRAVVYGGLRAALKEKSLVVGTTRRLGRHRGPIYPVKEAARRIREYAEKNPVAILFGREDRGLTNTETAQCAFLANIPADPKAPSYNLAQAVLLAAYETALAGCKSPAPKLASHEELSFLYERLARIMEKTYEPKGDRNLKEKIMKNLKHLVGRAGVRDWELKMLHGLVSQMEKKLN
jgi:TrmH family RNA methyltransferase